MQKPIPDASPAAGKGRLISQVLNVEDAKEALRRADADPKVWETVKMGLGRADSAVFLWGHTGLCVLTILDSFIDGRFAWITYLQNEKGWSLKNEIHPMLQRWAEMQDVSRIAAAVEKEGHWFRLTGYKPWKLIISKEF